MIKIKKASHVFPILSLGMQEVILKKDCQSQLDDDISTEVLVIGAAVVDLIGTIHTMTKYKTSNPGTIRR